MGVPLSRAAIEDWRLMHLRSGVAFVVRRDRRVFCLECASAWSDEDLRSYEEGAADPDYRLRPELRCAGCGRQLGPRLLVLLERVAG